MFPHNLFGNTCHKYFDRAFQPLEISINPERNSTNIKILSDKFEVEEIIAMLLEHIKEMSQKFGETTVKDCTITVPSFWNRSQRIALISTAQAAGLNVLSLINENTAAAFYYGIDRFDNETDHYTIFYNLGSSYLQVALAKYSTVNKTSLGSSGKIIENIEILAQTYDDSLGGSTFDSVLAEFLANKFEEIHKHSIKHLPKIMVRLFQQANLAKRILSASRSTLVIVNNIYKGIDFKYSLSREEFEQIISPYEERLIKPILQVLEQSKIEKEKINFLEILGGVSRVPKIQEIIKEKTGFDASTHLNGDEAMAHGAALFGANFSSVVQVKPIWLSDVNKFDVYAKFYELPENKLIHEQVIFDHNWRLAQANIVRLQSKKNIRIVMDDITENEPKPIGVYEISGVENITQENYNLTFTFAVDYSGISFLYASDAEYEIPVKKTHKKLDISGKKKFSTNSTKTNKTATEQDAAKEKSFEDMIESFEAKEETVTKPEEMFTIERKTIPLTYDYYDQQLPKMLGSSDVRKIRSKLLSFKDDEKKAKELAELKNELESYIYYLVDKNEEQVFMTVTTAEEREALSQEISETKEWMESSDFDAASISEVKKKRNALVDRVENALVREAELELRDKAVEKAKKDLRKFNIDVITVNETKPWISAYELDRVLKKINDTEEWINEKVEEQNALELWEPVAFTSTLLETKMKNLETQVEKLKRMTKPKKKDPFFPDFMNFGDDFDWEKYKREHMKQNRTNSTGSEDEDILNEDFYHSYDDDSEDKEKPRKDKYSEENEEGEKSEKNERNEKNKRNERNERNEKNKRNERNERNERNKKNEKNKKNKIDEENEDNEETKDDL